MYALPTSILHPAVGLSQGDLFTTCTWGSCLVWILCLVPLCYLLVRLCKAIGRIFNLLGGTCCSGACASLMVHLLAPLLSLVSAVSGIH